MEIGTPNADPLTCGLALGRAAGRICDVESLAPRRLRTAFLQGVSIRLADSSVLVAEVSLDTLDENFMVAGDPCDKPVLTITRDWRFLSQRQAAAVFKEILELVRLSRSLPFDACVLDSRLPPARRSTVYVVLDDSASRRILALSEDQQSVPSRNSFVQFSVFPRDSAKRPIAVTGSQRIAPCREALRLAESAAR